jgi:hypothetical protein
VPLLHFHRWRSDAGADRALADAWSSSEACIVDRFIETLGSTRKQQRCRRDTLLDARRVRSGQGTRLRRPQHAGA